LSVAEAVALCLNAFVVQRGIVGRDAIKRGEFIRRPLTAPIVGCAGTVRLVVMATDIYGRLAMTSAARRCRRVVGQRHTK